MNRNEIVTSLVDRLCNDEELNSYLKEYLSKEYPDLDPSTFEQDEVAESKWYGLYNERMLTVLADVMSRLNGNQD